MKDLYVVIEIETHELIAMGSVETARAWAERRSSEMKSRCVVAAVSEFWKAGYRLPEASVDPEEFRP